MRFVEAHGWRRNTKQNGRAAQRLKLGLLAAAYEYCDHAAACFTGMDPALMQALGRWSQALKARRFFPRTAIV
jgi:hypothetical protein